jgi:hypothetical protein
MTRLRQGLGGKSAGEIKNPIKPLMELVLANNRRPLTNCVRQVLYFILKNIVFL